MKKVKQGDMRLSAGAGALRGKWSSCVEALAAVLSSGACLSAVGAAPEQGHAVL